jgi:hypothetical protein
MPKAKCLLPLATSPYSPYFHVTPPQGQWRESFKESNMSSSQHDTRETGSWESLPNAKGDMEVPVMNTVFFVVVKFLRRHLTQRRHVFPSVISLSHPVLALLLPLLLNTFSSCCCVFPLLHNYPYILLTTFYTVHYLRLWGTQLLSIRPRTEYSKIWLSTYNCADICTSAIY